jgi:hypothetical protein
MKKTVILLLLYFCGMACVAQNAEINEKLAIKYLEQVQKNMANNQKKIHLGTTPYEYIFIHIDTTNTTNEEKYGIVLYDNEAKISFYVFKKHKEHWENIHYEDSVELYPYHLNSVTIRDFNDDKINDIMIKGSDGGYRNEMNNLYVFEGKQLKKVNGIAQLGDVHVLINNEKSYFYTRDGCGCSGHCWFSNLFTINKSKLNIIGKLGCNCNEMVFYKHTNLGYELINTLNTCETYNSVNQNVLIQQYWTKVLKAGF